jgi:hypothetical protein
MSESYHYLKLDPILQPNQAARVVARARHQIKLPLVVEMGISENKGCLTRLARATTAAGANVILLTSDNFASVQAVLSELYRTVTLPLFVRCPITSNDQQQQLQALGAAQVIPLRPSSSA